MRRIELAALVVSIEAALVVRIGAALLLSSSHFLTGINDQIPSKNISLQTSMTESLRIVIFFTERHVTKRLSPCGRVVAHAAPPIALDIRADRFNLTYFDSSL